MKPVQIGDATLYLGNCLEILPTLNKVDAVVTDPPYGIDFGKFNRTNKDSKGNRYKADKYHNGDWDNGFNFDDYIWPIRAVSTHMIIWGGNYFPVLWNIPAKAIIFWNKHQPCSNFSDGELAWSNIDMTAKCIDFPYYGNIEGKTTASKKEHPTQKPVHVMQECIGYFKHSPNVILDPFMGSGTTGVACAKLGRKFIGIELEPKYFDIACERIQKAYDQPDMFVAPPEKPMQEGMDL